MLEALHRTIQAHDLIPPDSTVVVGVSGGADSLALLHALAQLQRSFRFRVHVASFDHGWRGAAGAADSTFVSEQARALGVSVTVGVASSGVTHPTEASARRARYDFLARVAEEQNTALVAVAHHADDQAETVLMRLLRGTGLHGLAGMRYRTSVPGHHHIGLIRPLLGITRAEIEAYCQQNRLRPRTDASNEDTAYLRNHLRLDILPMLRQINPQLDTTLVQIAEMAAVESDYVAGRVLALLDQHATHEHGRWRLPRRVFLAWQLAEQRRAVHELAGRVLPNVQIDYGHVIAAVRLAHTGDPGAVAQFPAHGQLRVTADALIFERADMPPPQPVLRMAPSQIIPITIGAAHAVQEGAVMVIRADELLSSMTPLGWCYLPPAPTLMLRTRRPGDRITPPGMGGKHQKLSDWMINRKISAAHREVIPLLMLDDVILAVLHPSAGIVCYPYHRPGTQYDVRYALVWQVTYR